MTTQLNDYTIKELLGIFDKIYTHDNLLVIDPKLSAIFNYLIPFKQFKNEAKFDKVIFNDASIDNSEILQQYQNIIILVDEDTPIHIPDHARVSVIVKNLTRSRLYELNEQYGFNLKFETILETGLDTLRVKGIKLFNWPFYGLVVDENVVTLQEPNSLTSYFKRPIYQINSSLECLINIISRFNFKINNTYSIGTNSNLFLKLYEGRLVEYLDSKFNSLQQEFYIRNMTPTHNLVVIERNVDFLPLVMNQLTYVGLIDELLDIKINLIKILNEQNKPESIKLDDELFDNLKHVNFSLIGMKLNKLARLIKNQYSNNPSDMNLKDIKNLIDNLTDLNRQQDLIKKHTTVSETLLNKIKFNNEKFVYNEYELFLNFQNEVFDMTYKQQLGKIGEFCNLNFDKQVILNCVIIVSIINSGIKSRDFETIKSLTFENYGIKVVYLLDDLKKYNLIRFNDVENIEVDVEGLTGGVNIHKNNYTLLNKFWNLHPEEEQENIDLINDYTQPSFTLPSNTVPLTIRLIESLFSREFLTYKPVNKITKQPSWENLNLPRVFKGPVNETRTKTTVEGAVFVFLGGITWSEVSCIKYLNEKLKEKGMREIIIITNGLVNNNHLHSL